MEEQDNAKRNAPENSCFICKEPGLNGSGRIISEKGLLTLIDASKQRHDNLAHDIATSDCSAQYYCHDKCYKRYTDKRDIDKCVSSSEQSERFVSSARRTEGLVFSYRTHCLICAKIVCSDDRHPYRVNDYSSVEFMTKDGCQLQQTLLTACKDKFDEESNAIKSRIVCAGDIRAVEAKYHRACLQKFLTKAGRQTTPSDGGYKNLDLLKYEAFNKLCLWLEQTECLQKQCSLSTLREKMQSFLAEDITPYTIKHLKRLLEEHFGDKLKVTYRAGKTDIVTFNQRIDDILHDVYEDGKPSISIENIVTSAGKTIQSSISSIDYSTSFYPPVHDLSKEKLEEKIPEVLQLFTSSLINDPHEAQGFHKKQLLKLSLANVLMQAAGPKSYISPLLLSIGLFIHQKTRSRILIDVLSSLGLCVPFHQVIAFQKACVSTRSVDELHPDLISNSGKETFCQWIADNFDLNEDTISGNDTTHCMGIITCQSPTQILSRSIPIPRHPISASEIAKAGDFSSFIKQYKPVSKGNMRNIIIEPLATVDLQVLKYELVDMVWLLSSELCVHAPNWQGFMSHITKGTFECTTVLYNPMLPLNPQTEEAVFSTMCFVMNQAKKLGLCCGTLTFDQPLFMKSSVIKAECFPQFSNLFLRLGGFHQLMSFLGSICKLMEGSGLEDLWSTVYAKNSLPKMFQGKAYSRTVRACLLTDAALHLLLMSTLHVESIENDIPSEFSGISIDEFNEELEEINYSDHLQLSSTESDMYSDEEYLESNMTDHDYHSFDEYNVEITTDSESDINDCLLNNEIKKVLKRAHVNLMQSTEPANELIECKELLALYDNLSVLKHELEKSRTGKLWIMFMNMVSIVRMFIRAERTGNWLLHLQSTQEMLPFFAAAGHNNYLKSCRIYLQECNKVCVCLKKPLSDGLFTIRRNESRFWSGTWTDMTIEQTLMRSGKTEGGLINITHRESAKTKWLLTAHIIAQYSEALRNLTCKNGDTWSEQHREMFIGCRKRDTLDLHKFVNFFKEHNPFLCDDSFKLHNISTGMIADERVNVDRAYELGYDINSTLNGVAFGQIVLKKSRQACTFGIMKKPIKVNGTAVRITSNELFQRFTSIVYRNGPPESDIFSYELAAVPSSLFNDDGTMRKNQKSQLAQYIYKLDSNIIHDSLPEDVAVTVFDGCALMHRLPWPKVGTLASVCKDYVDYVQTAKSSTSKVIFDSYEFSTSKEPEQRRRQCLQTTCMEYIVEINTPVPANKAAFLANLKNKQSLINLLSVHLEEAGIEVLHAKEEGDADTLIAKAALKQTSPRPIVVVSEDTDILILLIYHIDPSSQIYIKTKQNIISVREARSALGEELVKCLLFIHAASGCDTTSSLYGVGKVKVLNIVKHSEALRKSVIKFGDLDISHNEIDSIGQQFVASLYNSGRSQEPKQLLDTLRYMLFTSPKYIPMERLPPTSRACYFHCLRVHFQINTWKQLRTVLEKTEYGFQVTKDNAVVPIMTDLEVAPKDLLQTVVCYCKSGKCNSCTCSKNGIPCHVHCKCEALCDNI